MAKSVTLEKKFFPNYISVFHSAYGWLFQTFANIAFMLKWSLPPPCIYGQDYELHVW